MSLPQLVITAAAIAAELSVIMAIAWWVQQTTGNSGWVDAFWSCGVGIVATTAALAPLGHGPWPAARQITVAALAAAWSLRLGWHIILRSHATGDDPRYRQLIDAWQSDAPRRMFWFLQSQAAVGVVLALSIALAAHNPHPGPRLQDAAGVLILVLAIVGEAAADGQLRRFKASPAKRGAICDVGLWRWSRHPNYFFEWLAWLAYPVIAIDFSGDNPWGWLALLAPACMYWVLVYVSGIPPLEDHMLRSRGDAFRDYQRRTRAFFPFPVEAQRETPRETRREATDR
jgi:steroid 5-alpha reductase family enzyme